jgi:hypothetical protein
VRLVGGSLCALALLVVAPRPARANPWLHPRAATPGVQPPSATSLTCTNCHVSAGGGLECGSFPCFNPFGYAYWSHPGGWADVATLDTDGDGRTNDEEIYTDLTLPGFPEGATSVGCDMTSCASAGTQTCAGGVHCQSSHALHGGAFNHYAFWFTCGAEYDGAPSTSDAEWSLACSDADECAAMPCGPGACHAEPLASWTPPGYGCVCDAGAAFDGLTCTPPSECTTSAPCVPGATCTDPTPSPADAACACPPGTTGDGLASGSGCADVNECVVGRCRNAICRELPLVGWAAPGYECVCDAGYVSSGGACALDDECLAQLADCVPLALCSDPSAAAGDYACACPSGFVGDGRGSGSGCVDPSAIDAGFDAAAPDAGRDAGLDASSGDATVRDASRHDASAIDASRHDASRFDASQFDASRFDASEPDATSGPAPVAQCGCRASRRSSRYALVALLGLGLVRRRTRRPAGRGRLDGGPIAP